MSKQAFILYFLEEVLPEIADTDPAAAVVVAKAVNKTLKAQGANHAKV
jgi:hypothetical protein